MGAPTFNLLLAAWSVLGAVVFVVLLFVAAPYGRYARRGWGPMVHARAAWVLMEAPAAVLMAAAFVLGVRRASPVAWTFLGLWSSHYLYRSFVYPWLGRGQSRPAPLSIVLMGATFNVGNGYLNGHWLFELGPELRAAWLRDPRFAIGALLFAAGFAIHVWTDRVLHALRGPGESGYRIPRGGLFERVSCPNYLGEMVEWIGWALATWSLAGATFAWWTVANLLPRALAHHRWYRRELTDYPPRRRAVIPFVL